MYIYTNSCDKNYLRTTAKEDDVDDKIKEWLGKYHEHSKHAQEQAAEDDCADFGTT